jgi:hypothetical protein
MSLARLPGYDGGADDCEGAPPNEDKDLGRTRTDAWKRCLLYCFAVGALDPAARHIPAAARPMPLCLGAVYLCWCLSCPADPQLPTG